MTDAQKKEQNAILRRQRREMQQRIQQARCANKEREKFQAARDAIVKEFAAAIRGNLKPEQWERLDQIQLQAQGSFAFTRRDSGPMDAISYAGAPLAERLKLSDEQTKKIRTIADAGRHRDHQSGQLPDRSGFQGAAAEQGGRLQAARQPGIQGGQAEGPPGGPGCGRRGDPAHRGGLDRVAARGVPQGARGAVRPVSGCAEGSRDRWSG